MEIAGTRTPLGFIEVVVHRGALVALRFSDVGTPASTDPVGAVLAIEAYFAGDLQALDAVPVRFDHGTPFQRAVWGELRHIPVGATTSYGHLASRLGRPGAARAVGAANGSNPIPLVVPCHRVIASDGSLGGYGGGIDRKQWLLSHESDPSTSMSR